MDDQMGAQLIRELLTDPREFGDKGRAYDLLQAYFAGLPLDTLRALLRNQAVLVQRAAVFVASELGSQACNLLDDVIPLLRSGDRYLQYHAMEILAVCSEAERAAEFAHVVEALENEDTVLRGLAMRLVANADVTQLEAVRRVFKNRDTRNQLHSHGLLILAQGDRVEPTVITAMIHDTDPLARRYGAIAAKRFIRAFPNLLLELGSSDDPDLRRFYQAVVSAQVS